MESSAAAGSTSVLSTDAIIPGLEGKQDGNSERKETEQGKWRSDWKRLEANAAISTVRDGDGMDRLQEHMGKTLISTARLLCSSLFFAFKLLRSLKIACCAQTENCHMFFS